VAAIAAISRAPSLPSHWQYRCCSESVDSGNHLHFGGLNSYSGVSSTLGMTFFSTPPNAVDSSDSWPNVDSAVPIISVAAASARSGVALLLELAMHFDTTTPR